MLLGLGIAATAAAIAGGQSTCTPADPCLPDPTSASFAALGLALLVGWWLPTLAAAAAVLFAVLQFTYDGNTIGHSVFPLWAILHVGHLIYLRRARASQQRLAARSALPIPADWQRPLEAGSMPLLHWVRMGGVVIGLLGALVTGSLYLSADRSDAELMRDATVLEATVESIDPNDIFYITLRPERQVEELPELINLEVVEEYAVGERVPIRVNPADPDWTHLVAEPPDRTDWLLLGAVLLLAGLGATALAVRVDVRRRLLLARTPTTGLPVRILRMPGEPGVGIATVDKDLVCADAPLAVPQREEQRHIAPVADGAPETFPVEWGYVVGAFHDGGVIGIVTKDVAAAGTGPLSALSDLLPFDESWSDPEDDVDFDRLLARSAPVPVDDPVTPLTLPWRDRPGTWDRLKGILWLALAAAALVLLMTTPEAEQDLLQAGIITVVVISLIVDGADSLLSSIRVDRDSVRLSSAWRHHVTPLSSVVQVRRAGDVVLLVDDADATSTTQHAEDPGEDEGIIAIGAGEDAAALASALDEATTIARANHPGGGSAGFAASTAHRWRLSALVLALLIAAVVAVALRATFL